jgi:hypothetical protein
MDLQRFEELTHQAGQVTPADPVTAAARFREALALWRDEPLAESPTESRLLHPPRTPQRPEPGAVKQLEALGYQVLLQPQQRAG